MTGKDYKANIYKEFKTEQAKFEKWLILQLKSYCRKWYMSRRAIS